MTAITDTGVPNSATLQETINQINAPSVSSTSSSDSGLGSLGQADFLRLLTTQLQNQDPTEPVNNEAMLAQMAQFSALEANLTTNSTLEDISTKLDALIAAQEAADQPDVEA